MSWLIHCIILSDLKAGIVYLHTQVLSLVDTIETGGQNSTAENKNNDDHWRKQIQFIRMPSIEKRS
jgi:hypothetical protein